MVNMLLTNVQPWAICC